jgi:hypothetical protein
LPGLGQPKAKLNTLGDRGFATVAPGDYDHRVLVYDSVLDYYKHPVSLTAAVTTTPIRGKIHQHPGSVLRRSW